MPRLWPYVTPGIPDHLFEQLPGIPLSSRELRLLLLGYLRLKPKDVLWDIGAGTGTLAVEAALMCPQGKVVALERDGDVVELLRRNCDRFELTNVEVIQGNAPRLPERSPPPPRLHFCRRGATAERDSAHRLGTPALPWAHCGYRRKSGNPLRSVRNLCRTPGPQH